MSDRTQDEVAQDLPDNPWAFPTAEWTRDGDHVREHNGMTLRDYFAGQALAGWIASITDEEARSYDGEPVAFREHQDAVAATCYGYADAMLAARSKKP